MPVVLLLGIPATAVATTAGPHWVIVSTSAPTYFKAGDEGDFYELTAVNDGGAATDGSKITVTDSLPSGVTPVAIVGEAIIGVHGAPSAPMSCPTAESCEIEAPVLPGEAVRVKLTVSVPPQTSGVLTNEALISGGGAQDASARSTTPVTAERVSFGASLATSITGEDGVADSQAGSSAFALTTALAFTTGSVNNLLECQESPGCPMPSANVKDLEIQLPAGVVATPSAVPRCDQALFQGHGENCPPETQVGAVHLFFFGPSAPQYAPIFNVKPSPGQPAELGITVGGLHIPMFFHVRSDGDYGLTAQLRGVSETLPLHIAVLAIWGVPAAPSHNGERDGLGCEGGCPSNAPVRPFLRLPTSCSGAEAPVPFLVDSWQEPGAIPFLSPPSIPAISGCAALPFSPSISIQPTSVQVHSPTAYDVTLTVPQNEDPEALASADVRDLAVRLPAGTVLSASSANGLQTCARAQFEPQKGAAGECPPQSSVGAVQIATPVLEQPLTGSLFLGQPECSPCSPTDAQAGRMVPLLLEAQGAGVVMKLAGHASIDQQSGQLTASFDGAPQIPISRLEVDFKGGEDALLVNPRACAPASGSASATPWSASAIAQAPSPPVEITGCSNAGFTPSFQAGMTTTAKAGAFSGFAVTLGRPDGQPDLASFAFTTPPGLLGMLSGVPPCDEARADAGACETASEVGSASATIGPGQQPYELGGGRVFLTGPYRGQPFGLSIVLPAQAGPFAMAGTTGSGAAVVRASIAVDPRTAALTIASDELPHALDGIPLDISRIVVNLSRERFMFNPTNCKAMAITGAVRSASGATATASYPFQATSCAQLPFKPKLSVLTHAKTSKASGVYLHMKVVSAAGQANIAKITVDLPKQMPGRLTTLQGACPATVFDANPASCSPASVVGFVSAVSPILGQALVGPAYVVSHGVAALPNVEVVLQGDGITLLLVGGTRFKGGVTSSTWDTLPDVPLETFDMVLPDGPHSLLAANLPARARRSMCGQRLFMPVSVAGQNGAVVRLTAKIPIWGCPRSNSAKRRR